MLIILLGYLVILTILNTGSFLYLKQRFGFKFTALLIFQAFAYLSLTFIFTSILDIFVFPFTPATMESRMTLEIAVISGLCLPLFLSAIMNYTIQGQFVKQLTMGSIITGLFFIGLTIGAILSDHSIIYNTVLIDNTWQPSFSPLFLIMLGLYIAISILATGLGIKSIIREEYFSHSQFPIIVFSAGFIAIFIAVLLDQTIIEPTSVTFYVTGLLLLFIGVLYVFYNIILHPITTIYLRNNTNALFEKGLISWTLFSNRELGPTMELQSNDIGEHSDIKPEEIILMGTTSLMTAYNENKFIQNTSITPFAARRDYFAVTVSFVCTDETLTDHRFKNKLQSVLIIIIPTYIFSKFIKPVKNLSTINRIVASKDLEHQQFETIKDHQFLEQLCIDCLNVLV